VKKISLLITILAIYSINTVLAQFPNGTLNLMMGGKEDEVDFIELLAKAVDNLMLMTAIVTSGSGKTGTKTEVQIGGDDVWILWLDVEGNVIRDKTIGGNGDDEACSFYQTNDGEYIIVATSYSGEGGHKSEANRGECDIWMFMLDEEGNMLSDKTIGGSGYEYASSISPTPDGGYLIVGSSDSPEYLTQGQGESNYFAAKVKTGGTGKISGAGKINNIVVEWEKTIGGSEVDQLSSILQIPDGGYLLGGTSNSPISGDKTEDSKGGGDDFWIVWLDEEGNVIRDKTIGGNKNDELGAMVPMADGGYLLGGTSNSPISDDKTEDCYLGWYDYWVVKIDNLGNKIWDKTFGGNGYDRLFSMISTPDGGYLLGGESTSGISYDKTESCRGERDYWVIKIDKWGNKIWDKTIGGSGYDRLRSMTITEDLVIYLGGFSDSPISGDITDENNGGYDFLMVKLSPDTTGLDIEDTQLTSVIEGFTVLPAYPNPFNPSTTISYGLENNSHITVEIYDISGKLVSTLINTEQTQGWHSVVWNGTNQIGEQAPAGQYLSKITSGDEVKTTKLMLLK